MGIRLIILLALGLGSMWMIHLLAQDYNKIRKPIATAATAARLLIGKRDLTAVLDNRSSMDKIDNFEINWTKILKFDPLKCALALICEISAGAENAPEAIDKAYNLGATNPNLPSKCYEEYPFCPYSAKVMLKLLQIHSSVFGSEKSEIE